jgi:hypothetical protein
LLALREEVRALRKQSDTHEAVLKEVHRELAGLYQVIHNLEERGEGQERASPREATADVISPPKRNRSENREPFSFLNV